MRDSRSEAQRWRRQAREAIAAAERFLALAAGAAPAA
jgi:post-segregation antitoxin (ccd killing protein)